MRTGFTNAFPNKPLKKYYSYHGILMPCNIQPDPEPFIDYDTKEPGGPIVTVTFSAIMKGNLNYSWFGYDYVHDYPTGGFYGPYIGGSFEDFGGGWLYYSLYRIVIAWDTITIPVNCTILDARIKTTLVNKWSTVLFSITVQNGMPTYPHIPAVIGDYYYANYFGDGGSEPIHDPGPFEIELNSLGRSWVNKGGYTKFALLSDHDIVRLPPVANDTVGFSDTPGYWKLEVTYQEAA